MRLVFFLLVFSNVVSGQESAVRDILQRMSKAGSSVQTARFTIYGEERLRNGKMFVSERIVKLNVNPHKVYFYSITPDPTMEVLWRQGQKMTVNPGKFPFITLKVNHNSKIARDDSHHSIEDMGFRYLANLINYYMQNYSEKIPKWATIKDTITWQNHSCIHLVIDFKDFKPEYYTVEKGENLITIARKLHVNDYMIFSLNPSVNNLEDVKTGQRILVPNFYATRIEFYIDRVNWLPVVQYIYDQKGLYEKYEFRNLVLNPVFKPDEFTEDYKDYRF